MKASALISAAIALVATGVHADIFSISLPSVIQPDVPFNASLVSVNQQPRQYSILWGAFPYTEGDEAPNLPTIGTLGTIILTLSDLTRGALIVGVGDNASIDGLVIEGALLDGNNLLMIQAIITDTAGILNSLSIESFLIGPIAVGDHTSTTLVTTKFGDSNWKSWPLFESG